MVKRLWQSQSLYLSRRTILWRPINISRYAQLLMFRCCWSVIGAKMKIIRLWNTSRAFPSLASLRQRISRLGYVICFHIGGYASFLRPRRLAPFLISTYVTPFETLIGKLRWSERISDTVNYQRTNIISSKVPSSARFSRLEHKYYI